MGVRLSRPPLQEAILEFKWRLVKTGQETYVDPAYPLYAGSLFERIRKDFPFSERLPVAEVPDEITPHMVKQRFRRASGLWPVVQVGPGVASLNFAKEYSWDAFMSVATQLYPTLIEAYSLANNQESPAFESFVLRYVNAVSEEEVSSSPLEFLSRKLGTKLNLPPTITELSAVGGPASNLNLSIGLPLKSPKGLGKIQLGTGKVNGRSAFIWDISVVSQNEELPVNQLHSMEKWLTNAHNVAESWFFALIEGDLFESFGGEGT